MICLSRILLRPGILFASTEVLIQDSKPFAGFVASVYARREAEVLKEKDWENSNGIIQAGISILFTWNILTTDQEPGCQGGPCSW